MNVLFLLDYYLPHASANGVCVSKIVNQFVQEGDSVCVLSFGETIKAEQENSLVKYYSCCENGQDKKSENDLVFYLKWFLPKKYPSYCRKEVVKELVENAKKIIIAEKIEKVVCVHFPVETLIAGLKLKEIFPNVSIVAYMLDAFSGGILPRLLPTAFARRKKIRWENRILNQFDKTILMLASKNHHQKYSKECEWYKRAVFLDIPLLEKSPNRQLNAVQKDKTHKDIVFVGTMADNVRTPYHFLNVLQNISKKVNFIVAGKNYCGALAEKCNNPNVKISELGVIPYSKACELVDQADVLLNLGNTNPSLTPSKVFEYMSTGKPIISTYCLDEDSSIRYFEEYPKVLLLDERNNDVVSQAKELEEFVYKAHDQQFDYESLFIKLKENTPKAFVEEIKKN